MRLTGPEQQEYLFAVKPTQPFQTNSPAWLVSVTLPLSESVNRSHSKEFRTSAIHRSSQMDQRPALGKIVNTHVRCRTGAQKLTPMNDHKDGFESLHPSPFPLPPSRVDHAFSNR